MTRRIVSLLPSATEIVCALGAGADLVGRSHECDFPAGVTALPVCTSPKVCVDGNSEEIHASVMSVLEHEISVYNVDSDLLRSLAPTHIVTQIQCDVCAVSLRDVEASVGEWCREIVALNPSTIEGIYADIQRVGDAIGESPRQLIDSMKERLAAISARSRDDHPPRVATIEWLSPLMAAGNWVPELVEIAGGTNVFGRAGEHSPWLEWDDLVTADPDVIVIMPCGFSIDQSMRDLHLLSSHDGWNDLAAVRAGRVHVTDGNQYFNRPGPRIVESAEILSQFLRPAEAGRRCPKGG